MTTKVKNICICIHKLCNTTQTNEQYEHIQNENENQNEIQLNWKNTRFVHRAWSKNHRT